MSSAPVMIDVDTGIDDAVALALLLGLEADLVGVTTVAGNVGIDLATANTLRVLSSLGAEDVPVFRGSSRPLVASLHHAPYVHGVDGLAGADLPETDMVEQELTAPEAIVAMAEEFAGELVFVSVGPATNLAMALALRPGIVAQIARVVIMGGAYFTGGNRTPFAEFNAYVDPDALHQVYGAEWQEIIAVGLDVTHEVQISPEMWRAIPEHGTPAQRLVRGVSQTAVAGQSKYPFYLHDPLAAAVALDPSLVTTRDMAVSVTVSGEERGRTSAEEGGRVKVAEAVDAERFLRRFREATGIPYLPGGSDAR